MDGRQLLQAVLDQLDDTSQVRREDRRRIFRALDLAAQAFCRFTRIYRRSVTVTTAEGEQHHDLPPDFLDLYMQRPNGRRYVRYTAGADVTWPAVVPWEQIYRLNLTERQETPSRVAIREQETTPALITGTATAPGAESRGAAVLTDAAKNFLTTNRVWPRDAIHNQTKDSDGIVLAVTDATHLQVALFDGKSKGITSGDTYTIVPATRERLSLEAPAASAGHAIDIPYVGMPDPVYSDYGSWRLSDARCYGIASGAAMLLKLPESSWQEAQVLSRGFMEEVKQTNRETARRVLRETRRPAWTGW
jgi:hypothetical protein